MTAAARRDGDVILKLDNISLAFGGVKALTDISFDVREHEVRAIIGPERRRQELDAQRHQRRLPPAERHDHVPRQGPPRDAPARGRRERHRAHVPEHRAVPRA